MALTRLVIAVLTIAFVEGSNICCFPHQYHATQRLVRASVKNGHFSVLTGTLQYWKDGDSRRETFIETLNQDGHDVKVTVITDLNVTNTKYVITGNTCTKKSPGAWKQGCVTDSASMMEESYFGKSAGGLKFVNYDESNSYVTSFLTVSKDGCYPMFDVTVVGAGASPYMQSVQFHNFTVGISDMSIFDIPKICQESGLVG